MGRAQQTGMASFDRSRRANPALAAYDLIMFSAAILAIVLMSR